MKTWTRRTGLTHARVPDSRDGDGVQRDRYDLANDTHTLSNIAN